MTALLALPLRRVSDVSLTPGELKFAPSFFQVSPQVRLSPVPTTPPASAPHLDTLSFDPVPWNNKSKPNLLKKQPRSMSKSSGFRGVSRCSKDGRWQARIRVGKRVKYLGRFKTESDAAVKYDEAALALHGRRAILNFELSPEEFAAAAQAASENRAMLGFDDLLQHEGSEDMSTDSEEVLGDGDVQPSDSACSVASEDMATADDTTAAMGLMLLKQKPTPEELY
jgi:hypothetical protein